MKYEDITPVMRNFIGNYQGFRKLGYSADDLYCQVERSVKLGGHLGVFLVLKTQGKMFSVECGPVASKEETVEEYKRICGAAGLCEIPEEDLQKIWRECEVYVRKVDFVVALRNKGFLLPDEAARLN